MNRTASLLIGIICLVSIPEMALGFDPAYEAKAEELILRLKTSPDRLEGESHVIELFAMWDFLGGVEVMAYLQRVLRIKRISPRLKARTSHLLALGMRRMGDLEGSRGFFEKSGFIENWMTLGPFDNEGGLGLETDFVPEEDPRGPIPFESSISGKSGPVRWQPCLDEATTLGYTDLSTMFSPAVNVCVFAVSTIESTRGGEGILRIGAGGAFKAYWNGVEALGSASYSAPDPDRLAARIKIRKGVNRLLVKLCAEQQGDLGIYARLTDSRFLPWQADPQKRESTPVLKEIKMGAAVRPLPQPLEILYKRASNSRRKAADLFAAARFALTTRSVDPTTNQARDFARSACAMTPSPKNCLLWAKLAREANERREAISKSLSTNRESIDSLVALGELSLKGLTPNQALDPLDRIGSLNDKNLAARILRIELHAKKGFFGTAFAKAAALHREFPKVPRFTLLAAKLAASSGHVKQSLALHELFIEQRFDHLESRHALAQAALSRGDIEALNQQLGEMQRLWPGDCSVHLFVAEMYEGAGNLEEAQKSYELRTRLAPIDADVWKHLGLFRMRNGQADSGNEAFVRAQNLNPQDGWLSDYLSFLKPAPPFEQPYVVHPSTFLEKRRGTRGRVPARYLVDQTVVKVHETGLSSKFRQVVVEVLTQEAAQAWRRYPIQFSPSGERVKILAARVFRKDGTIGESVARGTVSLSEPWYRLYYDVMAEVLELPPISPGDVVELMYRVEDTSIRNELGNYFGDFVFIEDKAEKDLWRYVLFAPSDKKFYFNKSIPAYVKKKTERRGNQTVRVFQARGVNKIAQEYAMPGPSNTLSYLHVSTYRSWQELGDWYRGLIRNQLVPDAKLRNKVKELIEGKTAPRDKVGAIYKFVVTATRYVGLEFGIHGYKPYPVPTIVSRGFGDCKDKASLLIAMLKEAGIGAEFILIRTRDLGHIEDAPASLAVFNHAIAYVPSLDLWLDGTAENFGIDELPFGDQDASVLRVRERDAVFARSPVTLPHQNSSSSDVSVLLDPDGDANLEVEALASGYNAASLRRNLEVVQTRDERFEAELARTFPGGRLGKFEVVNLDDSSKPIKYRYNAFVPRFAKSEAGRIEIPVDPGLKLTENFGRSQRRIHDIVLGPTHASTRSVRIELPVGYRVDLLPGTTNLETRFGKLSFEIDIDGKFVEIRRSFELSVHRVSVSDYPDFLAFCKQVDDVLKGRIVLKETK